MVKEPGKEPANEAGKEPEEPTIDQVFDELPLSDKHKAVLRGLFTGIANQLIESNKALAAVQAKLAEVEKREAIPQTAYEKLSGEQIHEIELAKAEASSRASSNQLLQAMVNSGRNTGGGFDDLLKSADSINALRNILIPAPTPLQAAMEKAQVAQTLAQTRLMNKVVGKQTDSFLESIEKDLGGEGE